MRRSCRALCNATEAAGTGRLKSIDDINAFAVGVHLHTTPVQLSRHSLALELLACTAGMHGLLHDGSREQPAVFEDAARLPRVAWRHEDLHLVVTGPDGHVHTRLALPLRHCDVHRPLGEAAQVAQPPQHECAAAALQPRDLQGRFCVRYQPSADRHAECGGG